MDRKMKLDDVEDNWETSMGAWITEGDVQRVILRGRDVFEECKDWSWMKYVLFGITGREFGEKELKLCEAMWVLATSYPEPRLWPNRIASFAGTTRSTALLGLVGGNAIAEAQIYGHGAIINSTYFLMMVKERLAQGGVLTTILKELGVKKVAGYGRPLHAPKDERIAPLMAVAKSLGLDKGFHVKLAFEIGTALLNVFKGRIALNMNIATLAIAFCADIGLMPRQIYYYTLLCFTGGMHPCYIDALDKEAGSFLPLRCTRIAYNGPAVRAFKLLQERT